MPAPRVTPARRAGPALLACVTLLAFDGEAMAAKSRRPACNPAAFRTVVDVYQTTPQIAEALERLTEAYYSLGLNSEAQTAAAVLGKNYPGSPWYQAAYNILRGRNLKPMEDRGSWISQAFRKIL